MSCARPGGRGRPPYVVLADCPNFSFRLTILSVATAKNIPELKQRIVSAAPVEDDSSFELKLRPQRLAEFIGQPKVKENLAVAIEAAKSRGEALDHVLLYGPPGLGKTTLATIIANELAVPFQQTSGPTLQIKGDLTAILTNVRDKQVLFIDEVHRLQPALEEILYSALATTCARCRVSRPPRRSTRSSIVCSLWASGRSSRRDRFTPSRRFSLTGAGARLQAAKGGLIGLVCWR